ncbi:MAG TPA: phospholipase, partial [Rhodobacterales bacterium]|nr:phospholipase [Rhodobacterales bacterium]
SGETKSVVLFLQGYGADGADLLGLADPLGEYMPDTVFLAPDAPDKCAGNPMGFQWFCIPWLDGCSEEASAEELARAELDVDALIDRVLEEEGVTPDKIIVFGFSQGTMMALRVVPARAQPVAGIVGVSGRLLEPESLEERVQVRPPVLLVHGDQDEMVPMQYFQEAGGALQDAGFDVYAHVMKGTGHGIAPDGLSVALAFMAERLGIKLPQA